jgi:hypothetical protein
MPSLDPRSTPRSRAPGRAARAAGAFLAALLVLGACAGPGAPLPPVALTVDASVAPPQDALPGFADGVPRPLAAVTGDDGAVAAFVADELWLATDDPAELAAFLARWDGTVLSTFDPAAYGLTGMVVQYLVRVDASGADPAALAADLRALEPTATGDHRVSSADGLDLLAAVSAEARAGADVGLNWVGSGGQFTDRSTEEATSGTGSAGGSFGRDAFLWASHRYGTDPDIGVGEAWRALELAGKLGNRVDLAILDMGFQPGSDLAGDYQSFSNVPFVSAIGSENLLWCGGGNDCPWHGQMAASAAMALADDGFGGAGPGGPVARPVLVFTSYDFFTSITAIGEARILGARIANMSYSAPVPWYLGWSVLPFEIATAAFRATGMLLFAAAGNEGKDVDAEGCTTFLGCWERTWVTPCENAGVICVGGTTAGGTDRASGSNYGLDQVDLFAPYTLWLGPDPTTPGNVAQAKSGTSFSSPFVAGVAALVWAADPSLGAGDVEDILLTTAHVNDHFQVGRRVNAFAAVRAALGNVPPYVELDVDGVGVTVPFGVPTYLSVTVQDVEDPLPCCGVAWTSDVDGALGDGWQLEHTFASLGARTVTATATDPDGASTAVSILVEVVNFPPQVTLTAPEPFAEVFQTATVVLRATATDVNQPGGALACSGLTWTSSVPGDADFPAVGCEVPVAFASNGNRTLTVTATDPQGASDVATVQISVVDPPPDLPPNVVVTTSAASSNPPLDQPITLMGDATDPEDAGPLTYEWTYQLGVLAPVVIGDQATIQWTPNQSIAFNQAGLYTVQVRLNVTDQGGNVGTDFVTFEWNLIF